MTLRRAVSTAAAGASSEEQFFSQLADAGIMIRKRFSTRNPRQVTGYAVASSTGVITGGAGPGPG